MDDFQWMNSKGGHRNKVQLYYRDKWYTKKEFAALLEVPYTWILDYFCKFGDPSPEKCVVEMEKRKRLIEDK